MDVATPATSRRDLRRVGFRIALLAGVVLLVAGPTALWNAGRGAIPAPVVAGAAIAVALGLILLARGLIGEAALERRNVEARFEELGVENADLYQRTRELQTTKSQLEDEAGQLQAASRESELMLGAVRAHLMLTDDSYRIASRYSSELERLFGEGDLADRNFLDVLQHMLSERMHKTAADYLALLFDPSKKERTVAKVNPLDEVEISLAGPGGAPQVRYLSFGFRRILQDGAVTRVLVSVEDVTERTIRQRRLRESERHRSKQFELLVGILDIEPSALDEFLRASKQQLAGVDEALRTSDFVAAGPEQTALLRRRLDLVLERLHAIKGHAALLRLGFFERKAHEIEQKIVDFRHRANLGGDDFLSLVIAIADLRADLDGLEALRAKLAGIKRSAELHREADDDLVANLSVLIAGLSATSGREVELEAERFDSRALPVEMRLAVKDVLVQLARNSLVHGIEEPSAREAAGKPRAATIEISSSNASPGVFAFTYRDDGRGLSASEIRRRAVDAGMLSALEADAVDDSEVAAFIFEPGFTTAAGASLEAGRGMGMSLVKRRIVDDFDGEILVNSEPGRSCEFSFELPLGNAPYASAARQ